MTSDQRAAAPPPGPDCARYADDLPLLHDADLPAAALAAARAHAATCPHCQDELARYAEVEAALRARFTAPPSGRTLFTAAGIIRQAGASALPPLRPTRWPVAAVTVGTVVLLVALIVALMPRHSAAGSSTAPPTPTPTKGIVIALCGDYIPLSSLPSYPYVALRVVMTSPHEGWAVGYADAFSHYAAIGYLLHWQNGLWRQAIIPGNVGLDRITIVNAVGPTDVWFNVVEDNKAYYLLHYLNGRWSKLAEPVGVRSVHAFAANDIDGYDEAGNFWHFDGENWASIATQSPSNSINDTVTMLAPNDGWAINNDFNKVLHWDGKSWQDSSGTLPVLLWSVSLSTPDDGWAGGNGDIYFHYHNGKWDAVPISYSVYQAQAGFEMLSPTEGWVGGQNLLAHYTNGTWQQVPSPLGNHGVIYNFAFAPNNPSEGWAAATDTATHSPRLLHYLNGVWQVYDILTPVCLGK